MPRSPVSLSGSCGSGTSGRIGGRGRVTSGSSGRSGRASRGSSVLLSEERHLCSSLSWSGRRRSGWNRDKKRRMRNKADHPKFFQNHVSMSAPFFRLSNPYLGSEPNKECQPDFVALFLLLKNRGFLVFRDGSLIALRYLYALDALGLSKLPVVDTHTASSRQTDPAQQRSTRR